MKPTDDAIALVAFLLGRDWLIVDDLREGLALLGFRRPSFQWLTARLIAMCKESAPRFERRLGPPHMDYRYEYRVTSWAATGLGNTWDGFEGMWIGRNRPTPRPKGLRLRDSNAEHLSLEGAAGVSRVPGEEGR